MDKADPHLKNDDLIAFGRGRVARFHMTALWNSQKERFGKDGGGTPRRDCLDINKGMVN